LEKHDVDKNPMAGILLADLQNQGVRYRFAPEDMEIGDKFRPRIDGAIHIHEKLLLILSPCRKLSYNELSSHEHAHFHPSGDPTPSPEDIQVTEQLVEAGRVLDIELLDHLVIGNQRFVSLKERLRW